jgi:cytochrome c biogenesis protein CcmG, thiol:disulfide interchange protein DsbE
VTPNSDTSGGSSPDPGRPRRRLLVAVATVPLIGLAVLAWVVPRFGSGSTTAPFRPGPADFVAHPVPEDRLAPGFDLPALDGHGSISLGSVAGRVVVLNIWASWCPPCRQEAAQLEEVWTRYRSRGVMFIGVDHLDNRSAGLAFVRAHGVSYPSAFDPDGTVAARYGTVGIPTTFVIDGDGRIVYRFLGRVQAATLAATLDTVLASAQ